MKNHFYLYFPFWQALLPATEKIFSLLVNVGKIAVQLTRGQQISVKDTLMLLNISQVSLFPNADYVRNRQVANDIFCSSQKNGSALLDSESQNGLLIGAVCIRIVE